MKFSDIIFWIVWCSMFVSIIGSFGYYLLLSNKEKKAFKLMLASPSDETVKNYIKEFSKSHNIITTIYSTGAYYGLKKRNDKERQAQGYEIINKNSDISEELKQELYFVFVSEGVIIKK